LSVWKAYFPSFTRSTAPTASAQVGTFEARPEAPEPGALKPAAWRSQSASTSSRKVSPWTDAAANRDTATSSDNSIPAE